MSNLSVEIIGKSFKDGIVTLEKKVIENLTQQDIINRKQAFINQKAQIQPQLEQISNAIIQMDKEIEECDNLLAMFTNT